MGYAHAYTRFPFKHMELFRHYERQAREAGRGLWAEGAAPPGKEAKAEAKGEAGQGTVYVTRTGKKYHAEGCRHLAESKTALPLQEAKQRYTPCPVLSRPSEGSLLYCPHGSEGRGPR